MKRFFCAALATLTLLFPPVSILPTAQAAQTSDTFSDVSSNYWANSYIERAYNNSWVRGMGDGRYAPTQPLTNAAFLTMITNVFFSEAQESISVPAGEPWYALYWQVAQKAGITEGTTVQSMADMTRNITRYDMAQMIMNVLEKELYIPEGAIQQVSASIQDWDEIPSSYQHAVAAAYALGVLNGKEGKFAGADPMTRAESAVVLCRMNDAAINGYVPSAPTGSNPSTKPDSPPPANVNPNESGNTSASTAPSANSTGTAPSTSSHTSSTSPSSATNASSTAGNHSSSNTTSDNASSAKPQTTFDDGNDTATDTSSDSSTDTATDLSIDTSSSSSHSSNSTSAQATTVSDTATTSDTTFGSVSDRLAEVVRLTNLEREKEGLSALGTYSTLTQAAQLRAPELKRLFSHTRPDGTSYVTALEETGAKQSVYTYGENIFSGSNDPAAAVEAWMDSTVDRKNILNAGFTHMAVGYYNNCWVQLFVSTYIDPDDSFDSNDNNYGNNTSGSANTQNIQSIQFFPPVVQVRTNGQHFPTVLDQDFREVSSGVTWTNETPDLFTINKRTRVCEIGSEIGTGSLIATVNGRTARLIIEIVDSEDKIDLSSTMILSSVDKSQTIQLYVPRNSYFHGQDYTVSWDVQDPNVVQIEEVDTTRNPGIRCTMMNAGTTSVTCTVTLSDGFSTSTSCYVHVAEAP